MLFSVEINHDYTPTELSAINLFMFPTSNWQLVLYRLYFLALQK